MSISLIIAIGVLGGLGSISRFLLDGAVSIRFGGSFPLGTFTVNALGALLLGAISNAGLSSDLELALGAGALGGFTTFSTWMLESHRLAEDGRGGLGAINFLASLAVGIVLVWAGRGLGGLL